MTEDDLCFTPIAELAPLVAARAVSPRELTEAVLRRIETQDGALGAFVTVTAEIARQAAAAAEREIMAGRYRGPLHGIPVSLKDIVDIVGVPTTGSSRVLAGRVAASDAAVVERLRAAGAVLLGKTKLWELAMRSEAEPIDGPTRNPWHRDHATMGSSSGSAAAVAAGLSHAAIGTDTGGSIRGPASACGVVGFKPTYGLVSRRGVVPVAWSLDHVGPLTRTVADCALATDAIAGFDPGDPGSRDAPPLRLAAALGGEVSGLRLGVPDDLLDGVDGETAAAFEAAVAVLVAAGASRHVVSSPLFDEAQVAQSLITMAESASVHEEAIRARPEAFGPNNRLRTELGSLVLATDYLRAQRVRTAFVASLAEAMAGIDAIVTPTSPAPPPRLDAPPHWGSGRDAARRANNRFRWPFNLSGWPAVSVPCGFTRAGLPLGLQIAAQPMRDALVLKVAEAYERRTEWHAQRPGFANPLPMGEGGREAAGRGTGRQG